MSRLIRFISLLFILFPTLVQASVNLVVSVKPIQLIVYEITAGVTEPQLLISSNASPHDYALKPSDIKKINTADLVIWFGPELEPFLSGVLAEKAQSLQLGKESTLSLHEFGEEHHHDDGHHHHGTHDPHVWLGPVQVGEIAKIVADKLSELDAENRDTYQQNYRTFVKQLDETVAGIKAKLKPVKHEGYYVFHDAYGYFERYFEMNKIGQFTVSPERKPGAKTLIQIRTALRAGEAKCVFSEPQFKPSIVQSVTRGSNVNIGELDPLAIDIPVQKSAYFTFLNQLADSYVSCLSEK